MAKLPTFDRNASCSITLTSNHSSFNITKVLGFIMACRLYIRIRIRNVSVEKQIQWVCIYKKNQQIFRRKI